MAIKVKITADAAKYRQALRELGSRTKETFGTIGSQSKKLFQSMRSELNGTALSFKSLAKLFTAGGAMALMNKGLASVERIVREIGERYKAAREESMSSLLEGADQQNAFYKRQTERSRRNAQALSVIEDKLYQQGSLSTTDRAEQRRAIRQLESAYHDLGIEVDATTGKVTNYSSVLNTVLERDQKEELRLLQAEITQLEKARGIAKSEFSYTGSWGGEYLAQLKENLGFGSMDKASETERASLQRLLELRRKEHELRTTSRFGDAWTSFLARGMDRLEDTRLYEAQLRALVQKNQQQDLILQGKREEAALQQLINEHESKGARLSEERRKKLHEQIREQGRLNLAQQQQQQMRSLYERALAAAGRSREAEEQAAIRRAEETRGGALSADERAATLRLVELTRRLEQIGRFGDPADALAIRANSLTARGGGGGARLAERAADRYARATVELTRYTNDLLRDIRENTRRPVADKIHKD